MTRGQRIAAHVIVVEQKPDDGGPGGDWWIGFQAGDTNAFWDVSAVSRANAETCAAACREYLANLIDTPTRGSEEEQ